MELELVELPEIQTYISRLARRISAVNIQAAGTWIPPNSASAKCDNAITSRIAEDRNGDRHCAAPDVNLRFTPMRSVALVIRKSRRAQAHRWSTEQRLWFRRATSGMSEDGTTNIVATRLDSRAVRLTHHAGTAGKGRHVNWLSIATVGRRARLLLLLGFVTM